MWWAKQQSKLTRVQGLKGEENEDEDKTGDICVKLAKECLDVKDSSPTNFLACRRLSGQADSGIIIRFRDLKWETCGFQLLTIWKRTMITSIPHEIFLTDPPPTPTHPHPPTHPTHPHSPPPTPHT